MNNRQLENALFVLGILLAIATVVLTALLALKP